nr:hypothetical protein [Polymorphobacter sp.]
MLGLLLIAQASLTTIGPAAPVDLHKAIVQPCPVTSDEVTVCGHRDDDGLRLDLRPIDKFEPQPLRATTKFLGGTAGIEGDQESFGNGSVSKRAMVKLKFKF